MAMPTGTQQALQEALETIQTHVLAPLRPNFILVGGFALHSHGMDRATDDLDFFITAEALNQWEIAAMGDSRFTRHLDTQWSYSCSGANIEDVTVYIDFIDATTLSHLGSVVGELMGGIIWIATLEELAVLKAEAVVGRSETKDARDLLWVLKKMESRQEQFNRLHIQELFREVKEAMEYIDLHRDAGAELTRLLNMFAS